MISEYFQLLNNAFDQANKESINSYLNIANKQVHIRFANPVLASKLLPALVHLSTVASNSTDLEICVSAITP